MRIIFKMCLFFLFCSCALTSNKIKKINGVSFVASKDTINKTYIIPLINLHANYKALMPFGFIRELSHPNIMFNSEKQWFGERIEGVKQYVEHIKAHGIRVMIKPQIRVSRSEFTGGLKMTSEAD